MCTRSVFHFLSSESVLLSVTIPAHLELVLKAIKKLFRGGLLPSMMASISSEKEVICSPLIMRISASKTDMFCGNFMCFLLARLFMLTTTPNTFLMLKILKTVPIQNLFGDVFRHVMFTSLISLSASASTRCKKVGPSIHMLHGKSLA